MLFASIFVSDFSLAAVLRAEPELRDGVVAVLDGTPPLLNVVCANARAREWGLEAGMSRMQAETIAGIALRRRSLAKEAAAHAALLDAAQSFSPRVEDAAPDTVLLDISGMERLFGEPPKIARDLARRASDMGLEARVAVAANIETALHAARGFEGITVIPPGRERERLGELPVAVLAASAAEETPGLRFADILETLDRWGIRNLRAFAALPEIAVAERLGQEGLRLQKLARGESARTLVPTNAPLEFEEAMELDWPVDLLEPLAFLLSRMLEQLCARLQARALATNELTLRFELEFPREIHNSPPRHRDTEKNRLIGRSADRGSGDPPSRNSDHPIPGSPDPPISSRFERAIKLPLPMADAKTFLKLLQLDLRSHPPQAPVTKIWLRAEPLEPRAAQGGLFLPTAPAPERLEITLARIRGVVGDERVGAAEVVDSHGPDSFCMKPYQSMVDGRWSMAKRSGQWSAGSGQKEEVSGFKFQVSGQEPQRLKPEGKEKADAARLKSCPSENAKRETGNAKLILRRLRPPLAAAVEMNGSVPARVMFAGAKYDVMEASGPWRVSGDWWQDAGAWQRDEWDLVLAGKEARAVYRVYREVNGKWFVEGSYD